MAVVTYEDLCEDGKRYFEAYQQVYKIQDNSGNLNILLVKLAQTEVLRDAAQQHYESVRGSEQGKAEDHALKRLKDLDVAKNQIISACKNRIGTKVSYQGVGNAAVSESGRDMIDDYIDD